MEVSGRWIDSNAEGRMELGGEGGDEMGDMFRLGTGSSSRLPDTEGEEHEPQDD